jgi:NIMA (never in mitosis gene a)-related kinase
VPGGGDQTPCTLPADISTSSSVTDYKVGKQVGKGKYSVVYKGRRRSDNCVVVLKKLDSFDFANEKSRDKCFKEVRLMQQLHHPNIIRYLDLFVANQDATLVLEWAGGGDLKQHLVAMRKRSLSCVRFDEYTVWKLMVQMCKAMKHMHDRRVLHRDFKPANILFDDKGRVKIADFGLGRAFSENTVVAHSKVGTPYYMCPEVIQGKEYDHKCDIWSLGCVFYELAKLHSPFKIIEKKKGSDLYALITKITTLQYPKLPCWYSTKLSALAYRLLSLNAQERPNISEVLAEARASRDHWKVCSLQTSKITDIHEFTWGKMEQFLEPKEFCQLRQTCKVFSAAPSPGCHERMATEKFEASDATVNAATPPPAIPLLNLGSCVAKANNEAQPVEVASKCSVESTRASNRSSNRSTRAAVAIPRLQLGGVGEQPTEVQAVVVVQPNAEKALNPPAVGDTGAKVVETSSLLQRKHSLGRVQAATACRAVTSPAVVQRCNSLPAINANSTCAPVRQLSSARQLTANEMKRRTWKLQENLKNSEPLL